MPFFNFKGHQERFRRQEPTKMKEAYAPVAPYAYTPAIPYNPYQPYSPYAYTGDNDNQVRIMIDREGGDVNLHELIPGIPAPVYNGIDLPEFIKIQGTVMTVDEIPEEIEDEVRFQIEAEN